MNLSEFSLLADQNIHSDVVAHLRECQFDIVSVADLRLQGANDLTLIRLAFKQQRVVVTHDPDFGTLAILQGEPIVAFYSFDQVIFAPSSRMLRSTPSSAQT
jgi:predicted nuclease of predicted toxin-antitoxin system